MLEIADTSCVALGSKGKCVVLSLMIGLTEGASLVVIDHFCLVDWRQSRNIAEFCGVGRLLGCSCLRSCTDSAIVWHR